MKRFKCLFCIMILTAFFMLSGCHAQHHIKIKAFNSVLDDYYVDILIPIKETDDEYRNAYYALAWYTGNRDNEDKVKGWDIYNYNENGYKSMICHCYLEGYGIAPNGTQSYDVELVMNGYKAFKQLSQRCKKFKIAVFDKNGRIMKISDEYSMTSNENNFFKFNNNYKYIEHIEYDILANKVSVKYE